MEQVLLIKMGELVLKGLNRARFESRLLEQIKGRLRPYGEFLVSARQSTVTAVPQGPVDWEGARAAAGRVFGVAALSEAASLPKDLPAIIAGSIEYLAPALQAARSFKVEARRADKAFPFTSIQIAQELGGALHDAFPHLTVDVRRPEVTVLAEIRDFAAYIHAKSLPGAGGLPLGMSGKAVLLLSGGIDSPVAGWRMARRGLELLPVHFFSYPYTSSEARDKVVELARLMALWCGPMTVRMVPFTAVQEAIRRHCPEDLFTVIMRRVMMEIASRVARANNAGALITGESLGQVASQTMEAMAATEDAATLPVFRPLIGMDKEEIVTTARHIGTLETSILPFEDCCTVFTPRHPKTKPRLEKVLEAEAALDKETLIEAAVAGIEKVRVGV